MYTRASNGNGGGGSLIRGMYSVTPGSKFQGTASSNANESSTYPASNAFAGNATWFPRSSGPQADDWLKMTYATKQKVKGMSFTTGYHTYANSPNSSIWRIEGSTDGTNFDVVLVDNIELGKTLGYVPVFCAMFEEKELLAVRLYCVSSATATGGLGIYQCRIYLEE